MFQQALRNRVIDARLRLGEHDPDVIKRVNDWLGGVLQPAAPASAASETDEEVTVGDEPVTSAEVAASAVTPAASGTASANPTASEPVTGSASAPRPSNEGASEGT